MIESGAVCCAYETVEAPDRSLPLLIPMSEVAGRIEGLFVLVIMETICWRTLNQNAI